MRSLIRGIYRHAWVRSHRLWRDALPVFVELRARGIPVILLKGAALLHSYGNDWGARPMFDIDALVRPYRRARRVPRARSSSDGRPSTT